MDLEQVLNHAKQITGSDGNTARKIGVSDQAISNWRNREGSGPDDNCIEELAKVTKLPLEMVAAATYAKRTKNETMRRMWAELPRKIGATAGTALGALLVAGLMTIPNETQAAQTTALPDLDRPGPCVLCKTTT